MFSLNKHILKVIGNNDLIIDNFKNILIYDDFIIKIDNIVIKGDKLSILYIEDYQLKIKGVIKVIEFEI